ncbi:MAG TPA: TIGR03089 family protein [Candidatus Corynebacterium avicola]|uniref:TIGR03089 family protein n=1 Tax=Candidatus Corynebacterium avicola TaxID=2838527 RepID=A0A9D1RS51_9CORY|nr:TIGR03089 family protein [Candidatus Corynebacterium avicola]
MDLMAPLLASDAASPRLTTYTDAGRMELSAETVANWASKGGNLMVAELGLAPGDVVAVDAPADWMPAVLVLGCWRAGVAVCSPDSPAFDAAAALLTTDADAHPDFGGEVLLLSTDPFGRGVGEAGGDVPFGVVDLSPELRVQGDRYAGPETGEDAVLLVDASGTPVTGSDLKGRAAERHGVGVRAVGAAWSDTDGLVDCLLPLFTGGSVVVSTDPAAERLAQLADTEHGTVV